ncbi:YktB family protein [Bacillus sp. 03113]|uniref:YktB family protein n=1 Tax=Bacillus sp. 03113 TaxID=2578211 RepID=UPI001142661D|nr:DUF1054 domain-containing protein [Bacillus sp. 03113]
MTNSFFTENDFNVFQIDGLEARMEALKTTIRPKLEELGRHFSPSLSSLTGNEMYAHVARHARRTINPPKDTWVSFASNPRGYKMLPHFQIGLWGSHVFIWFAIIYEVTNKSDYGKKLHSNLNRVYKQIPNEFDWSIDHMKPDAVKHDKLSKNDLSSMFLRLQDVKKAEILCGYQIPREEAINMSKQDFYEKIDYVFKTLIPLYKLVY